jgi:hypothetical protein
MNHKRNPFPRFNNPFKSTITDQNLKHPTSKYKLTSNMTFLRRAFNMIGSLYNGNIQFLPFKIQKEKEKKETFHN